MVDNASKLPSLILHSYHGFFVNVAVAIIFGSSHSCCDASDLQEISQRAFQTTQQMESFEFSFRQSGTVCGVRDVSVLLAGDRFRISRHDLEPTTVGSRTSKLHNSLAAFNGKRQQLVLHQDKRVVLEDGAEVPRYRVGIPSTYLYAWLSTWGTLPYWSEIREERAWKNRFRDAEIVGESQEFRTPVIGVKFPDSNAKFSGLSGKKPTYYMVWFANQAGFVPIAVERRISGTDEISTSVEVVDYVIRNVSNSDVLFPLRIKLEESGADGVSLPQEFEIAVAEESIKINQPIDDDRFQLTWPSDYLVYDREKVRDRIREAEEEQKLPSEGSPKNSKIIWVIVANLLAILVLGLVAFLKSRRNS